MRKGSALFFLLSFNFSHTWKFKEPPKWLKSYWGPGQPKPDSEIIKPFKIDVSDEVIDDLNNRLDNWRESVPGLEGVAWNYGVPRESMVKINNYWRNEYNWSQRQELLNEYPQFTTEIQGLTIHFYHVKPLPKITNRNIKVLPLLIVHGWPGSVVEFQKLIPMLTSPRDDQDFVFEVVAPSIPGFGFSSGAVRPGLASAQIAEVLKNLMVRLGFNEFYAQGGDAGGIITTALASFFPQHVIAVHSNFCLVGPSQILLGTPGWLASLLVHGKLFSELRSLFHQAHFLIQEFGYAYIQGTKPDTIGTGLTDSPTGLAAYILEKFSAWTNPSYKFLEDGGITLRYTMDELLDNVMIYWISGSITTSQRLYAEQLSLANIKRSVDSTPIVVPSGCAAYPHELVTLPKSMLKRRYRKLIYQSSPAQGGHFAAFEQPEIFFDDLTKFVNLTETHHRKL